MRTAPIRTILPVLVLALMALSGCLGGGQDMVEDDHTTGDSGAMDLREPTLVFTADPTNGTVPLNITFTGEVLLVIPSDDAMLAQDDNETQDDTDGNGTMEANATAPAEPVTGDPYEGNFTWILSYGDGQYVEGDQTTFPLSETYTYNGTGNFTAGLEVTLDSGETLSETTLLALEPVARDLKPTLSTVLNRTYSDAATVGFPYSACQTGFEPEDICSAAYAKAAYDNGANGTVVLGYEFPVGEGAKRLDILATAPVDASDPVVGFAGVPDYDMYVFDPSGAWVATAAGFATEHEFAQVANPGAGTWTVVLLYFAGGPDGVSSPVTTTIAVLA